MKVRYFKLLVGSHCDLATGNHYDKGAVVPSIVDLVAAHGSSKFQEVGEAGDAPTVNVASSETTHQEASIDSPASVEDDQEEELKVTVDSGVDVTEQFPKANRLEYTVRMVDGCYYVFDDEGTLISEELKNKTAVNSYLSK